MRTLNILEFLDHIEERDKDAFRGLLTCSCGNQHFKLYYQGKRTKGILSPDIIKLNDHLKIEAVCTSCLKKIEIYDALSRQSSKEIKPDPISYIPFDDLPHKIRLSYNYLPEHYKTDLFEDIFIEINRNEKDKWHMIVED